MDRWSTFRSGLEPSLRRSRRRVGEFSYDFGDAVDRTEHQCHEADNQQHDVPYYHPRRHFVPVRGEFDHHWSHDSQQRETERADETDERSDLRHEHCDQN